MLYCENAGCRSAHPPTDTVTLATGSCCCGITAARLRSCPHGCCSAPSAMLTMRMLARILPNSIWKPTQSITASNSRDSLSSLKGPDISVHLFRTYVSLQAIIQPEGSFCMQVQTQIATHPLCCDTQTPPFYTQPLRPRAPLF